MENPPPVPPKDPGYTARMEHDDVPSAPTSGSKRKRDPHRDGSVDLSDAAGPASHSSKRNRRTRAASDADVPDEVTPSQQRNVRRKRGFRNLSNINLRQAAEKQAHRKGSPRESKFQEGSLTDKPSEKPPSTFMRKTMRTDSNNLLQVDQLMEEYHDDDSADIESENTQEDVEVGCSAGAEEGGFFRFGRNFAQSFHPVALWNKMWNETKEELTLKNMEEAQRKARFKAEAEIKYAQMKQGGQFELQPVGTIRSFSRASDVASATPRDSGVIIRDDARHPQETIRSESALSQLHPFKDDTTSRSESEVPESTNKPGGGFRSRLFNKSSLSHIRDGLKRMGSDFNLAASAGPRESSSSISPVKTDFDDSTLRHSHSKYDLKKQQRLTKRVSDLEFKLQQARRELDDALIEASSITHPRSSSERFAPDTIRKSKFVPEAVSEDSRGGIPGEETLKAREAPRTIRKLASLFQLRNTETPTSHKQPRGFADIFDKDEQSGQPRHAVQSEEVLGVDQNMDPNLSTEVASDKCLQPANSGNYASLDAKLKALEQNYKVAKNGTKSQKRKAGAAYEDDKTFKPDGDKDDDAEWDEAESTPRKKRRSATSKADVKAQSKHFPSGHEYANKPPKIKKDKISATEIKTNDSVGMTTTEHSSSTFTKPDEVDTEVVEVVNMDGTEPAAHRTSLDSQDHALEPLIEEEEETVTVSRVPLKDAPSKPTAKATPARHGRGLRSHSSSPTKLNSFVTPGSEEQLITRAARSAQNHPGRQNRVVSLPPHGDNQLLLNEIKSEVVSVVPGQNGVPSLPKGANGSFETLPDSVVSDTKDSEAVVSKAREKKDFQWPDDVF